MKIPLRILVFLFFVFIFSCKKASFTYSADAFLQTSVDTLHFNTIFTSSGSVSQFIKIINSNSKGIHISSIKLAGGNNSPFRINISGIKGPDAYNIDIAANDSAYIFVTASINPGLINVPFIVRDSIELVYNGNNKFIQLDALGQNAHFLKNKIVTVNETWNNDLPYVILGKLTIADNAILTINNGCHIYFHADAPFIINGSLQVLGNDSSRVIFTGDRLDEPYIDYPASYPGLIFTTNSKNNILNYAIIKNAYQGIVVADAVSSANKLTLNETIIDNAYDAGILAANTTINATNLLVSNCGKNLVLTNGGYYNFKHCTVATYANNFIQHKDPVLYISNTNSPTNSNTNPLNATFQNCIFWGENNGFVTNEVVSYKNGNGVFNVVFDHILWRQENMPVNASVIASITSPPLFDSINTFQRYYSFRLKATSPGIKAGISCGVNIDLDGYQRPPDMPDLGCYQKH